MKKKISFKLMIISCIIMVLMLSNTVVAFADIATVEDAVAEYGYGSSTPKSAITNMLHTSSSGDYNTPVTCPDGITYYYSANDAAKIIAQAQGYQNQAQKSAEGQKAVSDYSQQVVDLGLQADVATATGMLSGFMGVLRTLLGIIVVIVSVGMTVFSAFDLCYIAFPVFRNKCEDAKTNGGPLASNKKGANGEPKLRFVSDDAQYAVVAADTVQSGKNPFVIYFGKRLISYLVLAILLFILLTGKVTVFTDIAIRLVSGLIDMIQSI